MIYDKQLWICTPPDGAGAPFQGKLIKKKRHFYGELTVYHKRFWEAQAAGTRVDKMVQLPYGMDIMPTSYALLPDGHLYRIEEAQPTEDENGLPVTNLSLRRMEQNYELCRPD